MTGISLSELLTSFFILFGLFFVLTGSIGLIRFPDVYTRLHAPTKSATLGVFGILIASIIHQASHGFLGIKEILTTVFLFLTAPVGAHMIARAAYLTGVQPAQQSTTCEFFYILRQKEEDKQDADQNL
ncbi:MAG: Na+/H+ antiporter subunit G [Firmicutes bacterium]|nr:Na+/H+ antiporter subunit G [Bacillota bacterium]